ncbi:MAG: hypothetical protein JWN56_2441 [Sphingobacteriales bacterium]|nr:hypothetical protein [Sphingobacteriales bacterium]
MTKTKQIEIPLSKIKLTLMLFGSIAFVAGGIWMIASPNGFTTSYRTYNPIWVFVVGLASVIFFGLCLIYIAKKLADGAPGLIINDQGINDNSSGVSAGLILWSDIKEIRMTEVVNQKFLMLIVFNPDQYISRQSSFIKRKAMEINYKSYGSPISISANGLKTSFDELFLLLQSEFNYRKPD